LLDKVNAAPDAKDIADLQARIQVEQVMLQNESNKLQALQQLAAAQRDLQIQQGREISIKSGKGGLPAGW
jgi:type IV secretion system protein VirB5